MSSNINDYVRPTDDISRRDINKILSLIHDLSAQEPEETGLQERIMFTPHVKLRTTSTTFGSANLLDSDTLNKQTWNWRRKKPTSSSTYDLTHTTTGTFTFPVSTTWDGARADNAGTEYITITDHTKFDFTDEVTIAMKLILPASSGGFVLCEKVGEYRLRVVDTNTIEFAVYASSSYKTAVTTTYTPDTVFTIVATYDTTNGHTLYKDGVSVDSDALSGAFDNSSGNLCILATAGGTNIAPTGVSIAYFGLLNAEATATWASDYHTNSLYDTSDGFDEITTINFIGSEIVTPNAESGLFKSS